MPKARRLIMILPDEKKRKRITVYCNTISPRGSKFENVILLPQLVSSWSGLNLRLAFQCFGLESRIT